MSQIRKLGVFVGSPKRGLEEVREEVITAINSAGHIASGMELWAAGHIPTQDAIEAHLDICDIHIFILGTTLGSPINPTQTYVEWEYTLSQKSDRPVIPFLLEEDEFYSKIENEALEEPIKARLILLRKELQGRGLTRYFKTTNGTAELIGVDCVNSINEAVNSGRLDRNAGWIRAGGEEGKRLRSVEENRFLRKLLERMYRFSTLTDRLDRETPAKEALATIFWHHMLGRIKRQGYCNLFFESGSSLVYVSEQFEKVINESGDNFDWEITTNNALTLLHFLLNTHLNVFPRPAGAPEDHYGAMFDDILLRVTEPPPTKPRDLYESEVDAAEHTTKSLQGNDDQRLYLMTASGLDIDHEESNFRGPHVGSHPNMLFKRALFRTGQPIVLFLSENKVGKCFEVGNCYPVFGPDFSWGDAVRDLPVAICVGYSNEIRRDGRRRNTRRQGSPKRQKLVKRLKDALPGFDIEYVSGDTDRGGAFIAANDHFMSHFPKE